ncbi:MAG TPA: molybdopterin-dependent oxidoreductase [Candidatus Dormibacteraeota bacterium]|nr:molybdopterin-dependent oxidoreductase [Candidatus Dormibacteraeota bacterium]
MTELTERQAALRGFGWGAIAGVALVALMYLANLLLGLRPLPQLLNQPLLSIMPGFVFGFLIDTLQHAGKVVEELGLIVAMVAGLGVLGAAWAWTSRRWHFQYSALVFAAAGWLVVTAILLPISGSGFLGLNDGVATPLIWGALFAVYGVVVQLGGDRTDSGAAPDAGRRRMLSVLPVTIGVVSVGVLALRLVPDWYKAIFNPSEAGLSGTSPAVTPIQNFYVVSKNFSDPAVDGQGWRLAVGGLVDKPLRLSLADLRGLPVTTEYVTMECISNNVGGRLMSTGSFSGVKLRELLAMASPHSTGTWAAFRAVDGYAESLPMSLIQGAPEILVAYDLDGAPLPASHGFPARMLIPGHYGMKGPKWLDSIDLVDHESGGFWEQQGWDHNAVIRTTARFDVPHDGDTIKLGTISLAGVAFAGTRGIHKVEFSTDGGGTWSPAQFASPLSELTWVLWQASWTPSAEGAYKLLVRATDGGGALQDSHAAPSYPTGAAGYHTIQVNISKT